MKKSSLAEARLKRMPDHRRSMRRDTDFWSDARGEFRAAVAEARCTNCWVARDCTLSGCQLRSADQAHAKKELQHSQDE
jgi:hypothetical protein